MVNSAVLYSTVRVNVLCSFAAIESTKKKKEKSISPIVIWYKGLNGRILSGSFSVQLNGEGLIELMGQSGGRSPFSNVMGLCSAYNDVLLAASDKLTNK